MEYPKTLIICAGISETGELTATIKNLFFGWPIEKLLMVGYDYSGASSKYFGDSYVLRRSPSPKKKNLISGWFRNLNRIKMTFKAQRNMRLIRDNPIDPKTFEDLLDWIDDKKPDVVYGMIGASLSNIPYVISLMEVTKKPFVLHIADDWIRRDFFGLLGLKYNRFLNDRFSHMLNKAASVLCISQAMADEYSFRYNVKAHVFHNPVPNTVWNTVSLPSNETIRIMYFGSVERYHQDGILLLNTAIMELSRLGICAEGVVIGKIKGKEFSKMIKKLRNIHFWGYVEYHKLPEMVSKADILFMPFSFKKSLQNVRLSMPTKLTEYMFCPQPIIVLAPEQTALMKFAIKERFAYCITRNKSKLMAKAIQELASNPILRSRLSERARDVATKGFTTDKVCPRFQKVLGDLI